MNKTIPKRADKMSTLLRATFALLEQDQRTLFQISKDTGVPFYWLRKFSAQDIQAPSVNRVQFLYEKLSNKKLAI